MSTAPPPIKKPPPPSLPSKNGSPTSEPKVSRTFAVSSGQKQTPLKVVLYGAGGIGKSELASLLDNVGIKMLFIDLEQGTSYLNVQRISDVTTFDELRALLHDRDMFGKFDGVVIDSLTKAEELAAGWVIQNVPHEKGKPITCIEDYGFGKGFTHVYEALLRLLGDLDQLIRHGKHVVCIAHDCIVTPENPDGENFAKSQPRLQTSRDGKNSFRYRVLEWTDHLLCIKYDVAVIDGRGVGGGSRTIYCQEMPSFWAKSRSLSAPIVYERGSAQLWKTLLGKE